MNKRVDAVFVFIIFCAFAVSVFLVLTLAGSTYMNIESLRGQNDRIALSYARTKIRSSDSANSVFTGDFDGVSALHIEEVFFGDTYLTRVYFYDGWVRELFHLKGLDFAPEDGAPLIRANSLGFEEKDGMIRVFTENAELLIRVRAR